MKLGSESETWSVAVRIGFAHFSLKLFIISRISSFVGFTVFCCAIEDYDDLFVTPVVLVLVKIDKNGVMSLMIVITRKLGAV